MLLDVEQTCRFLLTREDLWISPCAEPQLRSENDTGDCHFVSCIGLTSYWLGVEEAQISRFGKYHDFSGGCYHVKEPLARRENQPKLREPSVSEARMTRRSAC